MNSATQGSQGEAGWTLTAAGNVPDKFAKRSRNAAAVLEELLGTPEQPIPASLLADAQCVAVIPGVKKIGFGLGGRYGRGLVSCRTGGGWSRPSFVSLAGGSVGLQIGPQELLFARGGALPAELAVFVRNLERFAS